VLLAACRAAWWWHAASCPALHAAHLRCDAPQAWAPHHPHHGHRFGCLPTCLPSSSIPLSLWPLQGTSNQFYAQGVINYHCNDTPTKALHVGILMAKGFH